MEFVDVQCFAGGFTLGAVRAGLKLVGKREHEGGFGIRQCEVNRRILGDDWEAEASHADHWTPIKVPVVISNPPCSGFSILSKPAFRGTESSINSCMWDAMRYAARCHPEIYVMESVRSALTKGLPLMRELRRGMEELTGERYTLHHVLQDSVSLGGCSKRPRYFMVLSKGPFGIEPVQLDRAATLGDAIGDLVEQPLAWEAKPYADAPTWWSKHLRVNHQVDGHEMPDQLKTGLSLDLFDRGDDWPQGYAHASVAKIYYETHGELPPSWSTRKKKTVATGVTQDTATWAIERGFDLGMFQTKRWWWDRPAYVVTGAGPAAGLHPLLPRFFTHREIARIMGFPDDWLIEPLRDDRTLQPGWGKGVSVHCGEWIANWARRSLNGQPGQFETDRTISSFITDVDDEEHEYFHDVSKWWKNASNAHVVAQTRVSARPVGVA